MRLKTSQTHVIECGKHVVNSTDICLAGTELACSYFPELRNLKNGPCSTNNSFANVFGFDCKFYYKLDKYCDGRLVDTEIGVGYLIQDHELVLLRRDRPVLYRHEDGPICPIVQPVHAFSCFKDTEYLIVQSYQPSSIPELLIDPFSLVVSTEDNPTNTVQLEQNSLLGRLEENAQSISLSSIKDYVQKSLCEHTKQLVLSCSQLDVKKIKTDVLQFKPSNIKNAKKGSLIYNETSNAIEYFDGERWRTFLWRFVDE